MVLSKIPVSGEGHNFIEKKNRLAHRDNEGIKGAILLALVQATRGVSVAKVTE